MTLIPKNLPPSRPVPETLAERVCDVLETLALVHLDNPTLDAQEFVGTVYMLTHTANAPGCRKNHPQWMERLEELEGKHAAGRLLDGQEWGQFPELGA